MSARSQKIVGHDPVLAGLAREAGSLPVAPGLAQETEQLGGVHGLDRLVRVRRRRDERRSGGGKRFPDRLSAGG